MTEDPWAQPQEVTDLQIAFPADVMHLMPDEEFCEEALKALPDGGKQWLALQRRWFHKGLPPTVTFYMAEGVDGNAAFRHLKVIQGSFQPNHEHKEAGVAYLASRWFTGWSE